MKYIIYSDFDGTLTPHDIMDKLIDDEIGEYYRHKTDKLLIEKKISYRSFAMDALLTRGERRALFADWQRERAA